MTQAEFSKKIGITQTYLSEIERDNIKSPSSSFFTTMVGVFNVSLDWLFTGHGDMFISESDTAGGASDDSYIESVVQIMRAAPEEVKREIFRCAEERKLIADLKAERQAKKAG